MNFFFTEVHDQQLSVEMHQHMHLVYLPKILDWDPYVQEYQNHEQHKKNVHAKIEYEKKTIFFFFFFIILLYNNHLQLIEVMKMIHLNVLV
jgi:hypothetical protein